MYLKLKDRTINSDRLVFSRNSVLEYLKANVPVKTLYIALNVESDRRLIEAFKIASDRSISILEVHRRYLDKITSNSLHQGILIEILSYKYSYPNDLLGIASNSNQLPLLVALDNISDPYNLGSIIRSVVAFNGHGLIIPQHNSASVTATTWRTSAGTLAKIPIARTKNLACTLQNYHMSGLQIVGLDLNGDTKLNDYKSLKPQVLVVGSENKGLSHAVRDRCNTVLYIPTTKLVQSLNVSVATGIALAEISRKRKML